MFQSIRNATGHRFLNCGTVKSFRWYKNLYCITGGAKQVSSYLSSKGKNKAWAWWRKRSETNVFKENQEIQNK